MLDTIIGNAAAQKARMKQVDAALAKVKVSAPKLVLVKEESILHTAASIRAEMKAARRAFGARWKKIRPMMARLLRDGPHADPIATFEVFGEIWLEMTTAKDVLIEAHFGRAQKNLFSDSRANDTTRELIRQNPRLAGTQSLYDAPESFVPVADPAEAAKSLNARQEISALRDEERIARARALAPLGSVWRTKSCQEAKVVAHGEPGGGDIVVQFLGGAIRKRMGFGLDDFQPGAWFTRTSLTGEEVASLEETLPVGSRWRRHDARDRGAWVVEGYDVERGTIEMRVYRSTRKCAFERICFSKANMKIEGWHFVRCDESTTTKVRAL